MPFPPAHRVIYGVNPLDEVICSVKFPAILKIDVQPPAEFQERLRDQYPNYRVRAPKVPAGVPEELAAAFASEAGGHTHEFATPDREWIVILRRDTLSVACARYERWEAFRDRLSLPITALRDVYRTNRFEQVALRYRDLIRRSALGLQDAPWTDLLRPGLVGPLADPEIAAEVEHSVHELVVHLPDDLGHLRVWHGAVTISDSPEQCYGIDAEFFSDQPAEAADAHRLLEAYNVQARNFFHWCIQDRLHRSMQPVDVPSS